MTTALTDSSGRRFVTAVDVMHLGLNRIDRRQPITGDDFEGGGLIR